MARDDELSERKRKILACVVEYYIRTGEPVGSKTLLELLPFSVSSATVRNEMAELDSLGYLEQPHTSAGRIPTDKAYRCYVDRLISVGVPDELVRRRIEAGLFGNEREPDKLLTKAGEVLADLTNCAAVSISPPGEAARVRRLEMIPVGCHTAMLVMLTSTGMVRSKICRTDGAITPIISENFARITSSALAGKPLTNIDAAMLQSLAATADGDALTMLPLLGSVAELAREAAQTDVKLGGQSNLLNYRELEENAYELMEFLRNGEPLSQLAGRNGRDTDVVIGNENPFRQMEKSSIILSRYTVAGHDGGTIGLIGPTRIDYAKLIPSVKYLADAVGRLINKALEEQ